MGLDDGHVLVGGAVVGGVGPALGKFVGQQRRLLVFLFDFGLGRRWLGLRTGSQHADEVAVPHVALGQFLVGATGRAEQIADDHLFEHGPKLDGAWGSR